VFLAVLGDYSVCRKLQDACCTVAAAAMGLEAKSPKCRLAPTVKQTGQESRGELCEIFKFWSFLQSKSVNNVGRLLQPYIWALRLDPVGALPPPDRLPPPKWKFLSQRLVPQT